MLREGGGRKFGLDGGGSPAGGEGGRMGDAQLLRGGVYLASVANISWVDISINSNS